MKYTPRQIEVLKFLIAFVDGHGYPPSRGEMAYHFGLSLNAVQQHIELLEKKGAIKRTPGVMRSLQVLVELE